MHTNEIKEKSISGAKWSIIFFGLSSVAFLLTNVCLGRISTDVLGVYTTVLIFVSTISTFILLGAENVLSNFIPKLGNQEDKASLIIAYTVIVIVFMLVALFLISFWPSIFEFLMRRRLDGRLLWFFLLLTPIFVISEVIQYALNGLMEIRSRAMLQRLQTFGVCLAVCIAFPLRNTLASESYFWIVLTAIIAARTVSLLWGVRILLSKIDIVNIRKKLYFPRGFWPFTVSAHAATIFSFAYNNIDRLFVLHFGSLGLLGIYQAVIAIWHMTTHIPTLLQSVMIPSFSSMLAQSNTGMVKSMHISGQRYSILLTNFLSILIICFSRQLLSIFGAQYVQYYYLLKISAIASSISTLAFTNWPLLFSAEKNGTRFVNSLVQIGFQLIVSVLLAKRYGLLGILLAKQTSVVIAQVIPTYVVVRKLDFDLYIAKAYYASVPIVIIVALLSWLFASWNLAFSTLLCVMALVILFVLGGYKIEDIRRLAVLWASA